MEGDVKFNLIIGSCWWGCTAVGSLEELLLGGGEDDELLGVEDDELNVALSVSIDVVVLTTFSVALSFSFV